MRILKAIAAYAALAVLMIGAAQAQVATPGLPLIPLGYCQLTSVDTSTLISTCSGGIPAGANTAYIGAEAQAIRYRDDGTAPTTTVGMPLASGAAILYAGTLSKVRVISQTAGAKVNILFYRSP